MSGTLECSVLAELLRLPDVPLILSQEGCTSPLRTADGAVRHPFPIGDEPPETRYCNDDGHVTESKRAKSTRQRQKDEMDRLRKEIRTLTAYLDLYSCTTGMEPSSLWRPIARCQRLEAQRSQAENDELHHKLELCAVLVKNLENQFVTATEKVRVAVGSNLHPMLLEITHQDRAIVSRLLDNLELPPFSQLQNSGFQLWHFLDERGTGVIHTDASGAYVFEHRRSELLPFCMKLVSEVSWRSLSDRKMHNGVREAAVVTQTEDTLVLLLRADPSILELEFSQGHPRDKTYLVFKRQQHNHRALVMWESLSYIPEVKQLGTPELTWTQRGWSEVIPHKLRIGDSACRVRSYTRSSIGGVDGPAAGIDQHTLRFMLTLVNTYTRTREHAQRSLESVLLDESARQSRQQRVS